MQSKGPEQTGANKGGISCFRVKDKECDMSAVVVRSRLELGPEQLANLGRGLKLIRQGVYTPKQVCKNFNEDFPKRRRKITVEDFESYVQEGLIVPAKD